MTKENTAEPPPETAMSNSDRLLQNLKADTLAARLVQTDKDADNPVKALKKTLMDRLEQVRQALSGDKN
jgi:hypothetical protein